jgi:hypothetical protein
MNTIQLIHYIATHPEFTCIVIGDSDDFTPMQAVEFLSSSYCAEPIFRINDTLEKSTLLVY